MKRITISLVTDTSGAGTLYSEAVYGKLYAVKYKPGSLATETDVTITCEDDGASKPVLTLTDAGTSALWKYPRDLVHDTSGTALTGTSGGDRAKIICHGRFKVVLAQGGGATSDGLLTLHIDED